MKYIIDDEELRDLCGEVYQIGYDKYSRREVVKGISDFLKSKQPVKYLGRGEVEKIIHSFQGRHNVIKVKAQIKGIIYNAQNAYRENYDNTITAICNLAHKPITRDRVVEVLMEWGDGVINEYLTEEEIGQIATEILEEKNNNE